MPRLGQIHPTGQSKQENVSFESVVFQMGMYWPTGHKTGSVVPQSGHSVPQKFNQNHHIVRFLQRDEYERGPKKRYRFKQ